MRQNNRVLTFCFLHILSLLLAYRITTFFGLPSSVSMDITVLVARTLLLVPLKWRLAAPTYLRLEYIVWRS